MALVFFSYTCEIRRLITPCPIRILARRLYQREYQQRPRARQGLTNPRQTRGRKAYFCVKGHYLQITGGAFIKNFYVTADPERQARIEGHPEYGREIFSWPVEP